MNEDEGQQEARPTVIYLPAEIEWYSDGDTWVLDIENQNIKTSSGSKKYDPSLVAAVSQLTMEMLAQLESLAAYCDDLETQIAEDDLDKIHGQRPEGIDKKTKAARDSETG